LARLPKLDQARAAMSMDADVPEEQADEAPRVRRASARPTLLEDVANDLALWIDETASKVALAFAPARAPFSAQVTEAQKLEYYTRRLFNADGTPNQQGRAQEVARLGAEGFSQVYQAVVRAHPELRPAPGEAPMPNIEQLRPEGVSA
jgi:hypothetical protein